MNLSRSEVRSFILFIALLLLTGLIVAAASGCSGRFTTGKEWISETSTEGGIRTVRTVSGSVWGGFVRLVEEVSIGELEGSDEYLLGDVNGITVGNDLIYVLDEQVPIVRAYDFDGRHVMDIGRKGSGPGEYLQPESIAVHPVDGRVFVRTPDNARINVYSPVGEVLDHWPIKTGFHTSRPFVMTHDGALYTYIIANFGVDVADWKGGMMRCGPEDALSDTIHAPEFDFKPWTIEGRSENSSAINRVPFSPDMAWVVAVDGSVVGGVSESYRFEIHRPDGTTVVVERVCEPVRVLPEEGRWHRDVATANMVNMFPGWVWDGRGIPGSKPAFVGFLPDRSGRIWVRRQGPGKRIEGGVENPLEESGWWSNPLWRDTQLVDVFDMEGRYLGEVDLPEGFRFRPEPHIEGEMVVAYVEDEEGIPYVKRYRLELPEGGRNR